MIPYGKSSKIRANLKDNHPPKGWVNWWEVEFGRIDKGAERQKAKRDIYERKSMKMIRGKKSIPTEDDCGCGKAVKRTNLVRKKNNIRKKVKKI